MGDVSQDHEPPVAGGRSSSNGRQADALHGGCRPRHLHDRGRRGPHRLPIFNEVQQFLWEDLSRRTTFDVLPAQQCLGGRVGYDDAIALIRSEHGIACRLDHGVESRRLGRQSVREPAALQQQVPVLHSPSDGEGKLADRAQRL